ncbi:hypothetical protein JVT61DRAFT_7950 [Boletus reticuloceps]|uniref:Tyrosine specific protein phosphatases domain-containing protein n=1 Tax=Boletus reticuloceps TaxID=495285 RepID=A0A8I2YHJ9_9AGAM|nr:hypothetical protein JVT61DRAFT_7950 [Boletus reticuloceps]
MADASGWHRFTPVTKSVPSGHKLYRASAPNYNGSDRDQNLTQAAVNFLVTQGIDSIISFNEYEYTAAEKERLAKATPEIKYLHLKLGDFKPPTLAQFAQANTFFLNNKSTLVHCGYGWGRTGTGITGLQIYTENGKNLQPLATTWIIPLANGGNNVEMREQVSVLSELRSLLFPRVTGVPTGSSQQAYAIINLATGYYLTLSTDKLSVFSRSPETVETTSSIQQAYQWVVTKDSQGYYTLSNKTVSTSFALTKSQGAAANDPVTYGAQTQGNALFTITEVASGDKGRYVISPKPNATLAVAINTPKNEELEHSDQSAQMPTLLASKNESNKFGLWILLAANF